MLSRSPICCYQATSVMPKGRTQPRAWFVKFWLLVPAAPAVDRSDSDVGSEHEPSVISPSDAGIRMCLTEVFDGPIREGRRIRCLQHVSFAYKTRDTNSGPADRLWQPSKQSKCDIRPCTHGFKTRESSTSKERQSIWNKVPVATGGSRKSSGVSSRIANAGGLFVDWRLVRTSCKGRTQKTAAPSAWPRIGVHWRSGVCPGWSK